MLSLLLIFLSGMCEGVMDTISFHYRRFKEKHKKAKDLFWDPEYSWLNKYNNCIFANGFKSFIIKIPYISWEKKSGKTL